MEEKSARGNQERSCWAVSQHGVEKHLYEKLLTVDQTEGADKYGDQCHMTWAKRTRKYYYILSLIVKLPTPLFNTQSPPYSP